MKPKFTVPQLIVEIRRLAQKYPRQRYQSPGPEGSGCKYTTGKNTPGCIIGQAMCNLDPAIKKFLAVQDAGACPSISSILSELNLDRTYHEGVWLTEVQHFQDHNTTWKWAIDKADERVKLEIIALKEELGE